MLIQGWLTSPVLCGHLVYLRGTDREQIFYDTHPEYRLISEEESREIDRILSFNRRVRGFGSTKLKYPCSGLVFCAECRSACYSISGANNYQRAKRLGIPIEHNHYFQCKNWGSRSCSNKKTIRMEVVENAVVAELVMRAESIANIVEADSVGTKPEPEEARVLRKQIDGLRSIGKNPAIESAIAEIERQISQLIVSQKSEAVNNLEWEFHRDLVVQVCSDPQLWLQADVADRQRVYRELVERILVFDGEVVEVVLKI